MHYLQHGHCLGAYDERLREYVDRSRRDRRQMVLSFPIRLVMMILQRVLPLKIFNPNFAKSVSIYLLMNAPILWIFRLACQSLFVMLRAVRVAVHNDPMQIGASGCAPVAVYGMEAGGHAGARLLYAI